MVNGELFKEQAVVSRLELGGEQELIWGEGKKEEAGA